MSMTHDTKTEGAKPGISFFNQTLDWTNSEIGVSASTENVGISANIGVDLEKAKPNVAVDNWFGWFTVAGFKTTIGNFNSRFSGGFLNKDIHDSNISFMPGNWNLGVWGSSVAADANNFTRNPGLSSRNRLATVGDYTFKFGDEMLILAKAGITGFSADPLFGDANLNMKTGYAFEAAFQMPLLVVDALVRVNKANTVSTSAFVTVNPVKAMNLLVGATLGWEEAGPEYDVYGANGYAFEFGVDLGLRFALSDNMSITAHGNIGRIAPNMSADGRKQYNDAKKAAKDLGGDTWKNFQQFEREFAPWTGGAVLNWTMGINDIFKIYAEGGFKGGAVDWDGDKTSDPAVNTIMAQFGTVIKPVANATVVAAVRGQGSPENGKMKLDIPVSVKVAF